MKGDLELSVAAIVRAGSRQRNTVAIRRNFPRWTSVGSLLNSLPIGDISSEGVNARTCGSSRSESVICYIEGVKYLHEHGDRPLNINGNRGI